MNHYVLISFFFRPIYLFHAIWLSILSLCGFHCRIVYLQLIPGDTEGEYAKSSSVSSNNYLEDDYDVYKDRYSVTFEEDGKRTTFTLTVTGE